VTEFVKSSSSPKIFIIFWSESAMYLILCWISSQTRGFFSSVQRNALNRRKVSLHFIKYNRNVLEEELATSEYLSLLYSTSDDSYITFEVRIFSSLLRVILFASYSVLKLLHSLKYCHFIFFYCIAANFHSTFQEMKPNNGYYERTLKIFSASPGIFLVLLKIVTWNLKPLPTLTN
jgi:hypothetical protein